MSGQTPTNTNPSSASRVGVQRSTLRRVLSAQETGLVLVIVIIMTVLTLRSGSVPSPDREQLPAGSTAAVTAEAVIATLPGGATRTYSVADGFGLDQRGAVVFIVRKQRVLVPAGANLNETDVPRGVEVLRNGARVGFYPADAGWSAGQLDDGRRVIERDPPRNKFLNKDNLILVATVASFIAIIAVGMTGIIVLGGIDLSVGSIYGLALVVGATVLNHWQAGTGESAISPAMVVPIGMLLCCAVGAAAGLVNGSASVGLGVHPFIITLGGMAVYRGIAFVTTSGLSVGDLPPAYGQFVRAKVAGMNVVPTLTMIMIGLLGVFVFTRTVFGRRVFAIGGNETAARYAGVPVGLIKVITFTLCGMLAGLSAGLALGYYGSGSSADGTGYELEVIAAAVVGGASLSGGRGSALGAVLGAIIIQLINNGFEVLGIDSSYRQIVIGLAIVLAVVVDQTKHRLLTSRR